MIDIGYVQLMSSYTAWQNRSIYAAADALDDAARRIDRGAFFGSIHATLNHLLWGDQMWMSRLAGTSPPVVGSIAESVGMIEDWDELKRQRRSMDRRMIEWAEQAGNDALQGEFSWYSNSKQAEVARPKWTLVVQLFNHGTHHRGQVHAMLTAAGVRPEDTDVQYMPTNGFDW